MEFKNVPFSYNSLVDLLTLELEELGKIVSANIGYNEIEKFIKIDNLEKMVSDFYDSYQENNWVFLGQLINSYWKIKREIDPNSKNPYIEKLYSDCRLNGAIGGKMDESLMILFVPKENQENIKRIMIDHTQINNSVDLNGLLYQEIFSGSSNCCK